MLFVSADPEQIPEEAKPVVCSFSCLGMKEDCIRLDGNTMGPFEIRLEKRPPFPTGAASVDSDRRCMLADLMFLVEHPPLNFHYRNRCPSPLQERCEELGGCEFQRLLAVPQVMGYFKPVDKSCYRSGGQD